MNNILSYKYTPISFYGCTKAEKKEKTPEYDLPVITKEEAKKLLHNNSFKSYNRRTPINERIGIGNKFYNAERIGYGGLKTVYLFEKDNEKLAIALPNKPDERWEEVFTEPDNFRAIRDLGLLTNDYCELCAIDLEGKIFPAIVMKPYDEHNFYILDKKNPEQTPLDNSVLDLENLSYKQLLKMSIPLLKDINTLIKNNVYLDYDSINIALTKDGVFRLFINDLGKNVKRVQNEEIASMTTSQKQKLAQDYLSSAVGALHNVLDWNIPLFENSMTKQYEIMKQLASDLSHGLKI